MLIRPVLMSETDGMTHTMAVVTGGGERQRPP